MLQDDGIEPARRKGIPWRKLHLGDVQLTGTKTLPPARAPLDGSTSSPDSRLGTGPRGDVEPTRAIVQPAAPVSEVAGELFVDAWPACTASMSVWRNQSNSGEGSSRRKV